MKSPAPGQNSICDFSGPTIGNHKGLTCSLTGKRLPFPHLACGQAMKYSLWRELQSRTWVLLAGLAHMHICILSSDTFVWSPFYLVGKIWEETLPAWQMSTSFPFERITEFKLRIWWTLGCLNTTSLLFHQISSANQESSTLALGIHELATRLSLGFKAIAE